jgi:predicted metal-dependent hydrolase
MTDQLDIDGLTFELRRSPRRRTVSVTVERQGQLIIRAPEELSLSEIESSTRGRLVWVYRHLARKTVALPTFRLPEFVSGESFSYLGRCYP